MAKPRRKTKTLFPTEQPENRKNLNAPNFRVLSVDWDFFFPNTSEYDWGHSELNPIYLETVWAVRASSVSYIQNKLGNPPGLKWALDEMNPNIPLMQRFWLRTVRKASTLVITDSHSELWRVIKTFRMRNILVDNYDAHHDLGYDEITDSPLETLGGSLSDPDCGNWALNLIKRQVIGKYSITYPTWRKTDPEHNLEDIRKALPIKISVKYGLPRTQKDYDVVFICRSSAWTPSWADNHWLAFVGYWKTYHRDVWDRRLTCPFVGRKRFPDYDQALDLKKQQLEVYEKLHFQAQNSSGKEVAIPNTFPNDHEVAL